MDNIEILLIGTVGVILLAIFCAIIFIPNPPNQTEIDSIKCEKIGGTPFVVRWDGSINCMFPPKP